MHPPTRDRLVPAGFFLLAMWMARIAIASLLGLFSSATALSAPRCDPDDGGLELPRGLCALVVADELGPGRHLAVNGNGDVYLRLRETRGGGTIVALRDVDGDGRADRVERFGEEAGTGLEIRDGWLWAGTRTAIVRWRLDGDGLKPAGPPQTVVSGFPEQKQHAAKTFAFDPVGRIYVNVGAPSNACQSEDREPEAPGVDPCPELRRQAGIWRFEAGGWGRTQDDGERFATGIRGAVALAWNEAADRLFAVQHGRDALHRLWPSLFTTRESAALPAEEMIAVDAGDDFGWPYCYYDGLRRQKVLAPEYGGDGRTVGRCEATEDPVVSFPAHWAPNDLLFYRSDTLGKHWQGGAFVAFHGSWDREPFEQQGYAVAFVPFESGRPAGGVEVFADAFAGEGPIRTPANAVYRPVGLAEGPDGSLYVSDSKRGRVWRIIAAASRAGDDATTPSGRASPSA